MAASILQLAQQLRARRTSALELTRAALATAAARAELNALITLDEPAALARAADADAALARGDAAPLCGIPLIHKDIFCTKGVRTTCGSRMLAGFVPPYDATVVERLANSGAVAIGKANMDEFAMGSSNENSCFGPVRNPWDATRVPGGSSGGAAAAVAAGIVPFATGTDTGGSIRQPAAFCGITGLKPTYGRVSRYGLVAFGSSLDQIGVLARETADAAAVLQVIAGRDPHDATTADVPVPDYSASLEQDVNGVRLGISRALLGEGLNDEVRASIEAAIDTYRELGAEIVDIDLPHAKYAIAVYYIIATAEASSNLARFDGVRYGFRAEDSPALRDMYRRTRDEGFGPEVKRRVMLGTYVLSAGYYDAYYLKAQKVRALLRQDFANAFAQCDAVLTPTAPTPAFLSGEKVDDPLAMYLNDIYTVTANLAGIPGISVPCGLSKDGLPIGLQLLGPNWSEARLFNLAHAYQKARPLTGRPRIYAS